MIHFDLVYRADTMMFVRYFDYWVTFDDYAKQIAEKFEDVTLRLFEGRSYVRIHGDLIDDYLGTLVQDGVWVEKVGFVNV